MSLYDVSRLRVPILVCFDEVLAFLHVELSFHEARVVGERGSCRAFAIVAVAEHCTFGLAGDGETDASAETLE